MKIEIVCFKNIKAWSWFGQTRKMMCVKKPSYIYTDLKIISEVNESGSEISFSSN